jgi:hypothetical protein
MNGKTAGLLALGALVVVGGGVFLLRKPATVPVPPPAAAEPATPPAAAPATPDATVAPADCLLPGPPPVPPAGATASPDDMKLGHDAMQHFVEELEAYQACRNTQADHTPGVTDKQKDEWISQGNAAVDEANALAAAYGAQLKIFKARPEIKGK